MLQIVFRAGSVTRSRINDGGFLPGSRFDNVTDSDLSSIGVTDSIVSNDVRLPPTKAITDSENPKPTCLSRLTRSVR